MISSVIIKIGIKTIKRLYDIKSNIQVLKVFNGFPSAFDQTLVIFEQKKSQMISTHFTP